MKNINLKNPIYFIVTISAVAWIVLSFFSGVNLAKAIDFLKLIPSVVTADLVVITIFAKYLWSLKIFSGWLVPFPCLKGTWTGHIYSDWINPETGESILPIPVMLTIKQSFFHVHCLMQTTEMRSFSIIEGFNIDTERQLKQLAYVYTSNPRIVLNKRSLPHDGAIIFDIIDKPTRKLVGRYWTGRKTIGEVVVTFHCKKLLEEIPNTLKEHPVTEENHIRTELPAKVE